MHDVLILADTHETGDTGILHLKRLWSKTLLNIAGDKLPDEWVLDNALLNMLGIGLLPAFHFLHNRRPDFTKFEQWVRDHFDGAIPPELVAQCNALILAESNIKGSAITEHVLSEADLSCWKENGYVVVRQAVPKEDCMAAADVIWDFLKMDRNDPATWYRNHEDIQGIMVQLFRHPALDKNRHAPRIRAAYEQLWGHHNLVVTTDKAGFNPPETERYAYRGIGLHWDVSLATPIPFGTQGILYLTDTTVDQGALTVVPGFHAIIEDWLKGLPAGIHPRDVDLRSFAPKPIAARAGDFIIWHHALPHGASPNRALSPRLVQYINWFDPAAAIQEKWI